MALSIRTTGGEHLASLRQVLRETGNKGLGKQMGRALRRATVPLGKAVRAEVPKAVPSGYAPLLSKSLRFRTAVRSQRDTARVEWQVHAVGKQEKRDLPSLNRGTLRHPLFGNRHHWYAQKVRRGVVDRPADRLMPDVRREMDAVIDSVAAQITRG